MVVSGDTEKQRCSHSSAHDVTQLAISSVEVIESAESVALYRLAPEHPFPAAVDDAVAVYRELLRTTQASDIAIFGTSAGAVLSAQVMVRLRETGTPVPAALGFFSGSADLARSGDSEAFLPQLMGESMIQAVAPYIGATPNDLPALSPIFGSLSGFPPTLVVTSTRDQLLSQSALFHRALRRAGVEADLIVFEAMPHAFWSYIAAPESDEAFGAMADFFKAKLGAAE